MPSGKVGSCSGDLTRSGNPPSRLSRSGPVASQDGTRLAAAVMTGPGLFALGQGVGEIRVWDGRPPAEK